MAKLVLRAVGGGNISGSVDGEELDGIPPYEYAIGSLVELSFNPKVLLPLSHIGEQDEFRLQDASSFAAMGEELSYWELLVRSLALVPKPAHWPPSHLTLLILPRVGVECHSFRCPLAILWQARVQSVNQILCGYVVIPETTDRQLDVTINPIGNRMRSEARVGNNGQQRLKLVRVQHHQKYRKCGKVLGR